jgi:voltage-gated potassium channel
MVLFAMMHFLIDAYAAGSYTQSMTRLDALYFVTTTLATVGFGDIAPVSELARLLTMLQMIGGLVLLGIVAKVLLGAAQVALDGRRADEQERG